MPGNQDIGLSFALSQLQENLSRQDSKLADHMRATVTQGVVLDSVSVKVENLIKTVSTGNGQPALLVQVHDLRNEVFNIHKTVHKMETAVAAVAENVSTIKAQLEVQYTPAQKAERWKALGILSASTLALITSIATIFGFHM